MATNRTRADAEVARIQQFDAALGKVFAAGAIALLVALALVVLVA